ncbi:MAG: hypothetical protein E7607_07770 [Ruminococcaceae bacterium]|nr:hypothetical protein [Oscillospiraceae bacterium]
MKRKILSFALAIVMILSVLAILSSCDDKSANNTATSAPETTAGAQKLTAPTVTLTGNVATWEANPNADKFEISIGGDLSYVENTVTSKTLANGQTFKVRAVGDGNKYTTSDWSNSVIYTDGSTVITPNKLSAPIVSISSSGLASWNAVPGAVGYSYKINGAGETVINETSVQLLNGQNISVKAVGDGINNADSDYSASQTYTAGTPTPQPTKLGAPIVTISSTGLASWTAVANASSYVYKINGGAGTPITATSVQLTDGQSIVVKAVGDGTNYTDGDYSASKTYTVGSVTPSGEAPTYLGIFASNNEPSQADGFPGAFAVRPMMMSYRMMRAGSYRRFGTALDEYFADSNNHFNANFPTESEYEIYSRAGETVYIQIWLNNPSQHTILSLKLNGTKYQVGGGLSSFFVEDNGQHYNCIYVAVTIPNGTYTEKTYTVTDIEYIADTYINADGTDEFMNNNDTVSIGLPYNAENPTISDFNPTSLTMNSCSATLNVADASGLLNLTGGWLGIAVYDGYNIVANQGLVIGNNSVSATGLVENTDYWIYVYLYADLHDGNGVTAHILFEQHILTPEAITVGEVNGTLLYNSEKDGYYGAIKVNTTLNSNTAEYIKLEILKGDEVVYTDTNFNGTATVSEGILCGNSYRVRIYYKDTEYTQGKYIEESAWINYLGTPWYQKAGVYTFVNDAVYYFQLSNGDANYPAIDSFTLKLYKEESARWVANDVLYILEHPTAIDDLNAQIDVLFAQMNELPRGEEMDAVYNQIQELRAILAPLEDAKWYLENRANNNTDIAYWQTEAAKGKYYYEFEYNGTDTEKVFKVGKYYYVVLDDALTYGIGGLDIEIEYKYDKQEGGALTEGTVNEGINLDRELTNHWVEMENVSYSDGNLTLTLFNERDHWTGIGAPYAIGYVYKVEVDGKVLYIDESKHEFDIDETAWFNEYIQLIKAGQSVDGLMEKYVSDYESSYTIPVDATKLEAGNRNFAVSIRLIGTDYEDGECQATRWAYSVAVYAQIEKPTIVYKELYGEYYGVVTPENIDNWYNDHYEYEAIDKNGESVDITIASEAGYARFYVPSAGTKVRVKIPASGYWLESEWSEWYTFDGIKVSAPTFGEYDQTTCEISWWADTANVSHYLYTINGGTPVRVELDAELSVALDNGDELRVMCVASEQAIANGYLDSEWVEYTCTDARQKLSTPANIRIEDGLLVWDKITGANRYIVEQDYNGRVQNIEIGYIGWSPKIGATYRVKAISEDTENYKPSNWSELYVFTVTLTNPEFQEIRRERVYWTSVDYAQGYNYKIGENGEVNTSRNYYLALSEIPVGEKLYVQAYAEGCTSSEWVMIYHNVTKLAVPVVAVSGGTASWSAIENAEGYLYKINGGEAKVTTELSVSGLNAGDTITVCATIDEFGYANSDWSEAKTQLPIMSAPVLDTSLFSSEGKISWGAVDGAASYEYEINGSPAVIGGVSMSHIDYGQAFRVRAICTNGEYEWYGEWCEIVIRVDTREQLATPAIAYDPEIGLTVAINDPKVSHYEVMFGQNGYTWSYYPPDGAYETEVITNSFAFPENDRTVYVKAVPNDANYRDSEWASLTITFE